MPTVYCLSLDGKCHKFYITSQEATSAATFLNIGEAEKKLINAQSSASILTAVLADDGLRRTLIHKLNLLSQIDSTVAGLTTAEKYVASEHTI